MIGSCGCGALKSRSGASRCSWCPIPAVPLECCARRRLNSAKVLIVGTSGFAAEVCFAPHAQSTSVAHMYVRHRWRRTSCLLALAKSRYATTRLSATYPLEISWSWRMLTKHGGTFGLAAHDLTAEPPPAVASGNFNVACAASLEYMCLALCGPLAWLH